MSPEPPLNFNSGRDNPPKDPQIDRQVRLGTSGYLAAMGEPTISCGESKEETYRFLWIRAHRRPIAIRIVRFERVSLVIEVELNGPGAISPWLSRADKRSCSRKIRGVNCIVD